MTKHTPGPWTSALVYARIGPDCRGSIAYSGVYGPKKGNVKLSEIKANGRLIAAAPDLLEAAREFVEVFKANALYGGPPLAKLEAAIAKAEGES